MLSHNNITNKAIYIIQYANIHTHIDLNTYILELDQTFRQLLAKVIIKYMTGFPKRILILYVHAITNI